jgi:hypothetical protein
MSELGDRRKLFTKCFCKLLYVMLEAGYEPMHGKDGLKHMAGSLHYEGLAVDIDLTKNGEYLSKTEDHAVFGAFWKTLDPLCRWGGDFKSSDGNHYSITYGGRS